MSKNIVFIVNLPESKKQGRSQPYQYAVDSWSTWCDNNNCELFVLTERIYPESYMNANWHKLFIFQLLEANKIESRNPDILNYLGFTLRKAGMYEQAEKYYLQGLEIKPDHNGINEYLGELYVKTQRIDLAKERLAVLKDCNCEEYKELEEIINNN